MTTGTWRPGYALESRCGVMHSAASSCVVRQEDEVVPRRAELGAHGAQHALSQALGLGGGLGGSGALTSEGDGHGVKGAGAVEAVYNA